MTQTQLQKYLQHFKKTSRLLRTLSDSKINDLLFEVERVLKSKRVELIKANDKDIASFKKSPHWTQALEDRLRLTESRIAGMTESLAQIRKFKSAFGRIENEKTLGNGLLLRQVRDCFGLVFFIFEARPNVITEAFALALKSRNFLFLKCGKEAEHSARFIVGAIQKAAVVVGLDFQVCGFLPGLSHDDVQWLLQQDREIDLVIPRGGDKLIETVKKHSRIPAILNDRGLCHLYVDQDANLEMALGILLNGKTQRPSVCNSLETVLVHKKIANEFLPKAFAKLEKFNVDWKACKESFEILKKHLPKNSLKRVRLAKVENFNTEHLDFKLNCKIVANADSALAHIHKFGSKHSEVIVTNNKSLAKKFQDEVDAAVVYWNASTRFTDGFEFGLGGEIGISTQKLQVRGPVGLESLTCLRWIVDGHGQVR